jgi:phosphohistidine phosphatase
MKRLFIIRHAKSSWKDLTLDDFDRPLNKRGKLNAPMMGDRLKSRDILPDIIISSPALRTKKTAKIIANKINYEKKIIYKKELYESSSSILSDIISKIDDKNSVAFIFGHNTGINGFVEKYVDLYDNVPTCGVVEIEFDCKKWIEIDKNNAKMLSFDYPKKVLIKT